MAVTSAQSSPVAPASLPAENEQRQQIARLRQEAIARYRPIVAKGAAPIRVMARMVAELQQQCRQRGFPETLIASEIANRTIGDVDLRAVTEYDSEADYRTLAEEFGLALPGEILHERVCSGETYLITSLRASTWMTTRPSITGASFSLAKMSSRSLRKLASRASPAPALATATTISASRWGWFLFHSMFHMKHLLSTRRLCFR